MRIHLLSLAFIAALAACQDNPAASDATNAIDTRTPAFDGSPAIGTGLRDDSATVNSAFMGSGSRVGDESASVSSPYIGSGNRGVDGEATILFTFVAAEDGAANGPQTGRPDA